MAAGYATSGILHHDQYLAFYREAWPCMGSKVRSHERGHREGEEGPYLTEPQGHAMAEFSLVLPHAPPLSVETRERGGKKLRCRDSTR
jgi:hypothetical protein